MSSKVPRTRFSIGLIAGIVSLSVLGCKQRQFNQRPDGASLLGSTSASGPEEQWKALSKEILGVESEKYKAEYFASALRILLKDEVAKGQVGWWVTGEEAVRHARAADVSRGRVYTKQDREGTVPKDFGGGELPKRGFFNNKIRSPLLSKYYEFVLEKGSNGFNFFSASISGIKSKKIGLSARDLGDNGWTELRINAGFSGQAADADAKCSQLSGDLENNESFTCEEIMKKFVSMDPKTYLTKYGPFLFAGTVSFDDDGLVTSVESASFVSNPRIGLLLLAALNFDVSNATATREPSVAGKMSP